VAAGSWRVPSMVDSTARDDGRRELADRNFARTEWTERHCENLEGTDSARRREGLEQDVNNHGTKQRHWLDVILRLFPCAVQARALKRRKLNDSPAPLSPPAYVPASSPAISPVSSSANSPTSYSHSEWSSIRPSPPLSPEELHLPSLVPVSMDTASSIGSFQGVAQANVHGGTFYAAQTINIIVSPPFCNHTPFSTPTDSDPPSKTLDGAS
jgi:hypothetical protein